MLSFFSQNDKFICHALLIPQCPLRDKNALHSSYVNIIIFCQIRRVLHLHFCSGNLEFRASFCTINHSLVFLDLKWIKWITKRRINGQSEMIVVLCGEIVRFGHQIWCDEFLYVMSIKWMCLKFRRKREKWHEKHQTSCWKWFSELCGLLVCKSVSNAISLFRFRLRYRIILFLNFGSYVPFYGPNTNQNGRI